MEALAIKPEGVYLDCTFGRGGHARALLSRLGAEGRLIACDRDPDAVAAARALAADDSRLAVESAAFSRIGEIAERHGLLGRVDGILLDLGVSSPQLDTPERGFSFANDGPLDMRMDTRHGQSAADWLQTASQGEIAQVLFEYGEERESRRIARAIVARRDQGALTRTAELAALVARVSRSREPGKHPATRTFQALRIHVNDELDELKACLGRVCDLLARGGRLVVISFHSLEDRIVKRFIRAEEQGEPLPKRLPVTHREISSRLRRIGSPVRPSPAEVERNPRARSAIMRVAERVE